MFILSTSRACIHHAQLQMSDNCPPDKLIINALNKLRGGEWRLTTEAINLPSFLRFVLLLLYKTVSATIKRY